MLRRCQQLLKHALEAFSAPGDTAHHRLASARPAGDWAWGGDLKRVNSSHGSPGEGFHQPFTFNTSRASSMPAAGRPYSLAVTRANATN